MCVCVCVCVCVCMHVCVSLKIVSMDKILHIINNFSIIIITYEVALNYYYYYQQG